MSGTYNEVQVKKLGQKTAKKTSNPPNKTASHAPSLYTSSQEHTSPGIQEQMHQNPKRRQVGEQADDPKHSQANAAWPASLQEFVNKSFERAESLDSSSKAIFNQQMQQLIYSAAREKKIWTNDWTRQELPIFDHTQPFGLYQDTVEGSGTHKQEPQVRPQILSQTSPQWVVPQVSPPPLGAPKGKFDSSKRKKQRAARFHDSASASPSPPPPSISYPSDPSKPKCIVGTSTALEKRYLRLTSEPDPSVVRPQAILGYCLDHVVNKYRATEASYSYINDQLKAIRQDLTVQHIKGDLAVRVYETHGRIAIENNDLGEFNQCQAQLKHLYDMNPDPAYYKHTYEFTCYRILYLLLTGNHADINLARLEIFDADSAPNSDLTTNMSPEFLTKRSCVYKALELADFVTLGNYHGFFRSYQWYKGVDCMEGAAHLLEHFMANKQRVLSLNTMCKAFKKLPLAYLQTQLVLDTPGQFLSDFGLEGFVHGVDFDCSAARPALQAFVDQGTFKKVDIKGQV
ncbi:hypothetical protein JCM33374_g1379 [Metschnikowia sp. JCM 33374]|nr:hypothetical protein JCM33374_g1379 [Metschnikowia sp. JCM 33374]